MKQENVSPPKEEAVGGEKPINGAAAQLFQLSIAEDVPPWVRAVDAVLAYAQHEKLVEAMKRKEQSGGVVDFSTDNGDAVSGYHEASDMSMTSAVSSPKRSRIMSASSLLSDESKEAWTQERSSRSPGRKSRKRPKSSDFSVKVEDDDTSSGGSSVNAGSSSSAKKGSGKTVGQRWTAQQDEALRLAVQKYNESNWKAIAECVEGRNHVQCLQRWKKVLQPGLVKGLWTKEEDALLIRLMSQFGNQEKQWENWAKIAEHVPGRSAKQCRERWRLNLDPSINRGPWTMEEDEKLLKLHAEVGNAWAEIKKGLPGRTENAVKSRYKSIVRAFQKKRSSSA